MLWLRYGSLLMALGVALGAFGAHGLRDTLSQEAKQIYQTAVLYHFVHGLAILAVGWLSLLRPMDPFARTAGWAFLSGIALFSGSLYLLATTGVKQFGMITPLGGLAFLIGWLALVFSTR